MPDDVVQNVPLYDAVPITEDRVWRFFENRRDGLLTDNANVRVGPEHTNMPRSGRLGLPKNWTMRIERIRLVTRTPITRVGHLTFRVNGIERFAVTTESLLAGPIETPPVDLESNTPFCAEVYWRDTKEGQTTSFKSPIAVQIGELLLRINSDQPLGKRAEEQMQAWDTIESPRLVWCVLEGPRKIVIV